MALKYLIDNLIQKNDNFELIRDQIALILSANSENQMTLATNAGLDPEPYRLNVFLERTNPWRYFDVDEQSTEPGDYAPLINVSFDSFENDPSSSDGTDQQTNTAIFYIDCFGTGLSEKKSTGFTSGDKASILEAQRAVKLVRNILMAATNRYLGMQGIVALREVTEVVKVSLAVKGTETVPIDHVSVYRLGLKVRYVEQSPQVTPVISEGALIQVKHTETGRVIGSLDFDYTK